jgi:cytochrome b561
MLEERLSQPPEYGPVAKSLHWLIVLLILVQFALGWTMASVRAGNEADPLINLHFGFGVLVALLVVLRLAWRATHPVPLVDDGGPAWQHSLAATTHWLMYLLLLASPLLGWIAANARGFAVSFFGLFTLPVVMASDRQLGGLLGNLHQFASYALLGIVGLHVLAALYHHFLLRDRTLRRMLPRLG